MTSSGVELARLVSPRFRLIGYQRILILAVARNCVVVEFCGHSVKFNARYGAAEALRAVSADLTPLLPQKHELRSYVSKLAVHILIGARSPAPNG